MENNNLPGEMVNYEPTASELGQATRLPPGNTSEVQAAKNP
jgi:hypothetical protein